ncbi:protein kinase domain-containing protein [Colletotrichum chrysophilum]|uniref:non-specific serine/threonine protein kinase n=1 Tax=Colletotrichum chrysophilum TaxID=1836956 RepID=A0AAD9AEQ1_9PEZI|nr:protein kinase domain-containing protein [Colletotrichum chrysophilum]
MNQDQASHFAQEFHIALHEFRAICRRHTRESIHGQQYILVDNVTEELLGHSPSCSKELYQNDLDRLGKTAYLRHDPRPPKVRTQQYQPHLPIFYTLLDIGAPSLIDQFRTHKDLGTLPIALSALKSNIEAPNFPDFHEKFYEHQFAWCPIRFEMEMGRLYDHKDITPFTRKEAIKPYRDGKGRLVNTANLYDIEIPEELVGAKLQKRMASARISRQENLQGEAAGAGTKYRFALKQFKHDKHDHFRNEMEMFRNLENQDGMIQYIGWFRNFEPDADGIQQTYWNIVLELAEFDFYTAIRMESPPTSVEEISGFWAAMSEISGALASIHTVVIDHNKYLTWHGDIKPENILRVNDRFKLADPGEASMRLKSNNTTSPQTAKAMGGTRSYAAPEKSAYLDGTSKQMPYVPQTSDVWSLGCVLSIAATYVVLGTQGVLIYNQLRQQAIFNATTSKSDAFHNGTNVLQEVLYWHQYLRETARKNDAYSGIVLDMVDKHMLVDGDNRWSASKVFEEFSKVMSSINAPKSEVPQELQRLLENIDLQVETDYDHHSGINRAHPEDISKRIVPIPRPKLPQANIEFESRNQLLAEKILPVAQRSQNRTGSPSQSRSQSFSFGALSHGRRDQQDFSDPRAILRRQGQGSAIADAQDDDWDSSNQPSSLHQIDNTRNEPDREPMTVWVVRAELERSAMSWKPSLSSPSTLVSKRPVTIKGKPASNNVTKKLDLRLQQEFRDRDIVFLVDNGTTMNVHWKQATDLLEVLVWRSLGYDEDGVELRFTDPDTNHKAKVKESRSQSLKQFTDAMKLATPSASTRIKTNILPALERIVNDYTTGMTSAKSKPRKKTIIVLTDGIWEGMNIEYTLDVHLRSTFQVLRDLHGDLPYVAAGYSGDREDISVIRPITIQFVQFGNEPNAAARLKRLDDDMRLYGCPDLIDTEHANGDIYKMFLGSVCLEFDKKETVVTLPAISPASSMQNTNGGLLVRNSVKRSSTINQAPPTLNDETHFATPSRTASRLSSHVSHSEANQRSSMLSTPTSTRHELPADFELDEQNSSRLSSFRRSTTQRNMNSSSPNSPLSPDSGTYDSLFSPLDSSPQRSPATSKSTQYF